MESESTQVCGHWRLREVCEDMKRQDNEGETSDNEPVREKAQKANNEQENANHPPGDQRPKEEARTAETWVCSREKGLEDRTAATCRLSHGLRQVPLEMRHIKTAQDTKYGRLSLPLPQRTCGTQAQIRRGEGAGREWEVQVGCQRPDAASTKNSENIA
ncbi:hypothetical protein NDU88_007642 [Pleurodeles waltl]|uniref:Uncharacterized protein n=1 Tax=Pleurodeles waltl TaxID=8319 RepID=A0AAV7PM93_PLEWA|nr:hypothetical protein NDU88_007642 [Pleurodeles waltl]